jgi:hypothetical protein
MIRQAEKEEMGTGQREQPGWCMRLFWPVQFTKIGVYSFLTSIAIALVMINNTFSPTL